MMDNLKALIARCKGGVYIEINPHHASYHDARYHLDHYYRDMECPPEISDEVRAGILANDSIIDLDFYPDTPVGSYQVVHYDLDAAICEALRILGMDSA